MNWLSQCREWVRKYDPVTREHLDSPTLHHYSFMRRLSERLPDNAIIVSDTGGNVIQMGHCFQSKTGQRIFTSNGNTPMGFAMCGAIGAWFAQPERPIICIIGDGGFQLDIQELQTIKHYKVPVKIFVINNLCLGNTAGFQIQNGKKPLACGPDGYSAPDFCKIADAYGLERYRISGRDDADHIIGHVLAFDDEAVVCDVLHPYFCDYKPRMQLWDADTTEMFPPLPPDEYAANMVAVQPLDGWQERQKRYKEVKDVEARITP